MGTRQWYIHFQIPSSFSTCSHGPQLTQKHGRALTTAQAIGLAKPKLILKKQNHFSLKIHRLLLGKIRRSSFTGQVIHSLCKLPQPGHITKQHRKGKSTASDCLCPPHFHLSRASYKHIMTPQLSDSSEQSLCNFKGKSEKKPYQTKLLLCTMLLLLFFHSSASLLLAKAL